MFVKKKNNYNKTVLHVCYYVGTIARTKTALQVRGKMVDDASLTSSTFRD